MPLVTMDNAGETRSDARLETSEGPALREHRDQEVSPTKCMARDRPSPYGVCGRHAWRGKPSRMRVWHARAQALR